MSKKKREAQITNTKEQDPMLHLLCAMGDSMHGKPPGDFIEDMERRGNAQLRAQTSRLPTEGLAKGQHGCELSPEEKAVWEKMGIKVGKLDPNDPIFCEVELPDGWKMRPGENAQFRTELVDDKGSVRAQMFYKAAFYDRSAHIHTCSRFSIRYPDDYESSRDPYPEDAPCPYLHGQNPPTDSTNRQVVVDGDKVLFTSKTYRLSDSAREWAKTDEKEESYAPSASDLAHAECEAWLNENYPEWRDHAAYWDKE